MDKYMKKSDVIAYIRKEAKEAQSAFDELGGESGIISEAFEDLANELEDFPAADVAQWISVKDRLPKPTEQWSHCIVLVNVAHWPTSTYDICDSPYDEEFVVTAMYNSKQKIWHINGWDEQINALLPIIDDEPVNGSCVTHWMPLPKPPKGGF